MKSKKCLSRLSLGLLVCLYVCMFLSFSWVFVSLSKQNDLICIMDAFANFETTVKTNFTQTIITLVFSTK